LGIGHGGLGMGHGAWGIGPKGHWAERALGMENLEFRMPEFRMPELGMGHWAWDSVERF